MVHSTAREFHMRPTSRRIAIAAAVTVLLTPAAWAGPREQARRMHDRLAGVPPSEAVLTAMAQQITNNDAIGAAYIAMQNPDFYRVALKNWAAPWTNVDRTVHAPLNDFSATVIGLIRDDRPFTEVLTADVAYVGAPGVVPTPYSQTDNQHYLELEAQRIDLGDPTRLVPVPQSTLPASQLAANDTAGVLTTRGFGEAYFSAGTNRRAWRFTGMNFLCRDMEQLHDITLPVDRIRQDVTRSPGGDSQIFHNTCVGCHSGMDPMAGAFAYMSWDETQMRVVHTPGQVQPKYRINSSVFPYGYITIDNRWDNYWREGAHANLVWRGPNSGGYGPKTMGEEVAMSRAFSVCQVEKVFQHLCFRPPNDQADSDEVERIAGEFEANGHSMKLVFANVAAWCKGN
jgi:hypothetical protein